MIGTERDIFKAEVEVYNKTHYRWEWLLSRTLGYTILSSLLAIYVFWYEAGPDHPLALYLILAGTWVILMALGLVWFDFRTRVSYERWADVRQRLARHLFVSLISFVVSVGLAYAIHGIAGSFGVSNPGQGPIGVAPANKAVPGRPGPEIRAEKRAAATKAADKAPVKKPTPAKPTPKPSNQPATNKPAAKPATAKPVTAKTPSKPAPKTIVAKAKPKPTVYVTRKAGSKHPRYQSGRRYGGPRYMLRLASSNV